MLLAGLFLATCCYGACEGQVFVDGSHVGISGCISQARVDEAIKLMPPKLVELVIQSHGGDVVAALSLAREIRKRKASIRVRGYCESSCANYVLPAGTFSVVEVGARIAFHGDARITMTQHAISLRDNPVLLKRLSDISSDEADFAASNARAALIHEAQVILFSNGVVFLASGQKCHGLGLQLWTPTNSLLLQMKILDRVVPIEQQTMTMIEADASSPGGEYSADPFDSCVR